MSSDQGWLDDYHTKAAKAHLALVAAGVDPDAEPVVAEVTPEEKDVADAKAAVEKAQADHIEALKVEYAAKNPPVEVKTVENPVDADTGA